MEMILSGLGFQDVPLLNGTNLAPICLSKDMVSKALFNSVLSSVILCDEDDAIHDYITYIYIGFSQGLQ